MPPRRLWWINHYATTPQLAGGTRHYEFGCELAARGWQPTIFACDVAYDSRQRRSLSSRQLMREEQVGPVRFVWVNAMEYRGNDWRRIANLISFGRNSQRAAALETEAPDLIIGSSPHLNALTAARRIAQARRVPYLVELRDLWPQALIDMGALSEWNPGAAWMRRLERTAYADAKAAIVLAQGSVDYLRERGFATDRVLYLPNSVDLAAAVPSQGREKSREHFGFRRFTVVYAGAHGPANALAHVIEASLLVDPQKVEVVLVGNGPDKQSLTELAARLKAPVRFMDPVPKSEVPNLLAAADACLITLRDVPAFHRSVSPNKLFDYMAAGRPVLCSVPGDMAKMVAEAGAGIPVTPENPQALADAIASLCSATGEERAAYGERGAALIRERFDRRRLADDLESFLVRILAAG